MRRYLKFMVKFIGLLIVFYIAARITIWLATSGHTVTAPDLQGKNVVDALKEVGKIGLDLRVVREEYDSAVPRNGILGQDPKPGVELKVDRNIEVVVSLGARDIAIPDVRGTTLRKAELILKQNGLSAGLTTRVHAHEEEGAVLSQNPMPLTVDVRENAVDLLASAGPRLSVYSMPDLIGMDFNQAVALLESARLPIGNVRYEVYTEGVVENRVLNQSPAFGYPVSQETPVSLVVHRESSAQTGVTVTRIPFSYRIPFGLMPVDADLFVEDRQGRRRVFSERKLPGSLIELPLEISGKAVVEVYLNGKMVQSLDYR
ncbi:MAG: hypothetical protein COW52_13495 [Nitrospirae bacterium CG17_big_fil_post_rev_8_21_14_2_50_50_9]|nr:MAG: hypothetical protein COW52_13495 [Nitrospirae bacterium CG17_big_fil_post_rev_8_21_14_2_50_50_9]